jgi:hypothetical protein
MLVLKLIGVAMLVVLVVRWKRARLPLSLLLALALAAMVLQHIHCNPDESDHPRRGPIEPLCPYPTPPGCPDPIAPMDASER